ncbi:MAG: geranylgeranylglyceryl/heptaprenylglyceryl phosphate synthase [Candidatus Hodarchaeales archaeon]|jgi:putative glycerol-1-phosphate prenyltransferase
MSPELAVLIDPNHVSATENLIDVVEDTIVNGKSAPSLTIFVGCSHDPGQAVKNTVARLSRKGLAPVIFPGNPFQVSSDAAAILVPTLLNNNRKMIGLALRVGLGYIYVTRFWNWLRRRPRFQMRPFGYLILSPHSSAGRKLRSRELSDEEALTIVESTGVPHKWWAIYLEAGSGATNSPVAKRLELVRATKELLRKKGNGTRLITGGGITTRTEIRALFDAGADIVVVSTALERSQNPRELLHDFLKAVPN